MSWFETIRADIEMFFDGQNPDETEIQQHGRAAVDAFHDLFMSVMDDLKIRDKWPEQSRRFSLCPTQNIEKSAKMQIDFTMGIELLDGWFFEAPIVCEQQIRFMKDDFWAHIIKLASIGRTELEGSLYELETSAEIKRLTQHKGSLVFSIARNFTLLALTPNHNLSVGTIKVAIPLESDEATVTQFYRDGLEALYRSNYLLHRSDYLEHKRKSKNLVLATVR